VRYIGCVTLPIPETLSIIVPLYKSEANLPLLFSELERIAGLAPIPVEVVFVDDGSPDRSGAIVERRLVEWTIRAQLIRLSRNFGSFAAITAGLAHASGEYCVMLAADLQEPPELALEFLERMRNGDAEVVFGQRTGREDPALSKLASRAFWGLYRRLVNPDIPSGGVDVFGCTRKVQDQICSMKEVETSLPALLFWVGYRRAFVPYQRRQREHGESAWTFGKKMRYLVNSVFSFTDLPIRALLGVGVLGMALALIGGVTVLIAKASGSIVVPGYSATVLTIFFFGGLTSAGLGIVGQYLWLCLQNTRGRPLFIVSSKTVSASTTTNAEVPPPDPQSPRPPSATSNPGG
jgi:glycosyltransferase involved in cell wall biosynthesis